jgi:hypothetical protein
MVPLDYYMGSFTALHCSNNLRGGTESYYKASLIKVLDIIFMYAMLLDSIAYSLKLLFYDLWILLLCTLVCNPLIILCT